MGVANKSNALKREEVAVVECAVIGASLGLNSRYALAIATELSLQCLQVSLHSLELNFQALCALLVIGLMN
jgi:hypothetical protein